jgi:HK97 family phage prohead protease
MLEQKSFHFEVKEATDEGKIVGYASTFDNLDEQGDIVRRGAFLDSIADSGRSLPVLWQHRTSEPIGKTMMLAENEKGLFMEAKLLMTLAKAREALSLVKEGIVRGLSIGYEAKNTAPMADNNRELLGIKLFEVSLVTFPANEQAQILAAKMTVRELERFLRDVGFSNAQARRYAAEGLQGLPKSMRDDAPDAIDLITERLLLPIDTERVDYGLR